MYWTIFWQIIALVLYLMNIILVVIIAVTVIMRKNDPIKTLSWLVVIILLPYIGVVVYLLLGKNYRKNKIYNRKGHGEEHIRKQLCSAQLEMYGNFDVDLGALNPFRKLICQNLAGGYSLLGVNDQIKIYFSGKEALDAMYQAIDDAQSHIHLQSFIFLDDNIGNKFKDLLIKKAKQGVEVRVLYDSVGSWQNSRKFDKELKLGGVEVLEFAPVRMVVLSSRINYRNHRKLLVIDGKIGFIGGVNIADRYYDGGSYPEWRDTHMMITGDAVNSMQASFLLDRYFILNKNLRRHKKYYPQPDIPTQTQLSGNRLFYSQILRSGPDSDWASIMQCYFTAITMAKKSIKIVTPYFTPAETLLNAIKIAALGGIEVSIMVPRKSDSFLVHYSTMSYVQELLDAKVKVYLFKTGFNHSKVISIDEEFCIIGSANMDNRSMIHDFEIINVIYDSSCAKIIDKQFEKDIKHSTLVNNQSWKKRKKRDIVMEGLARLVSPLM